MAKAKIPDPLERRHLVERGLPEAQAGRVAQAYRAAGRELEALDFLAQAGDQEGLASVRREAVESGDIFLLRAAANAQQDPPRHDEWQALSTAAEAAGKLRYAEDARRLAEREEE